MLKKTVVAFFTFVFFCSLLHGFPVNGYASPMVDDWLKNPSSNKQLNDENEDEGVNVEDQVQQSQDVTTSTSFVKILLQLIFALAIVIGLIYVLLKFIGNKNKMFQKASALENLGGITLGSNKSLQVVRIGERYYVVGVGENVELLSEITDEKTKVELMEDNNTSEFNPTTFLASILQRKQRENGPTNSNHSTENFSTLFKNELNEMKIGRKKITDRLTNKDDDNHE